LISKNKKALVTGGTGFIGSHIVDELVKRGCEVTVIEHLSKTTNLEQSKNSIRMVQGAVTDKKLIEENVSDVDVIFHEASCNLVRSTISPIEGLLVNTEGTLNILESMKENAKNAVIVYASTGSVYGEPKYFPQDEEHPCNPVSPYGISKLASEQYIRFFAKQYGLKTVILRYYGVIGRRQSLDNVISIFTRNILAGKSPVIEGDGEQKVHFTSVKDVVAANMLSYEVEKGYGLTFNIAGNEKITINELARKICHILDRPFDPSYKENKVGHISNFDPSTRLAADVLGFVPKDKLEDVIIDITEWIKDDLECGTKSSW
jgi:UDP-glucose 4-epimerase